MFKTILLVYSFLACLSFAEAQKNTTLFFNNLVDGKPIFLFDSTYTNPHNENFSINKLKYYISHLSITYNKGTKVYTYKEFYHLVDTEDTTTHTIQLPLLLNDITQIEFLLGVDSMKQVTGVHDKDLDPMKGMFWTWNTGYIYAKLEGQSSSSTAPGKYFSYHVGGYKKGEDALRKISLAVTHQPKNNTIVIQTNVLAWFNGVHSISIKNQPICHQPGMLALTLADNYSKMFSVVNE